MKLKALVVWLLSAALCVPAYATTTASNGGAAATALRNLLGSTATGAGSDLIAFKDRTIYGPGSANDAAGLAAAAAAGRPLYIYGLVSVPTSITLGNVEFAPGARLVCSGGAVVTITGTIIAPDGQQIFTVNNATASAHATATNCSIALGQPLVKPEWFGDVFDTVITAIASLPATGGTVQLGMRRYRPNKTAFDVGYVSKDNIFISGAEMPEFSANADRLESGSIIEGRFNVFANNFRHENVGYDLGNFVFSQYYSTFDGRTANHPNTSTWDAFAFAQPNQGAPLAQRRNYAAANVRGLLRESLTFGHAVLQEGFTGGVLDNVVGMYGVHANVIKAQNVTVGFMAGYGASTDNIILKSDSYAKGSNIKIDTLEVGKSPPGVTPYSLPAQSTFGLLVNPATDSMDTIKISKARLFGASTMLAVTGGTTFVLDNFKIDTLEIEGTGTTASSGINFSASQFFRCSIGQLTINNTTDGLAYSQPTAAGTAADPLIIGSLAMQGITLRAIQVLNVGRVVANVVRLNTVATAYAIDNTARINVGREELLSVTTKFSNAPPLLTAGWTQLAGNSTFRVILENYGVRITGLIQPVVAGTAAVFTLPQYLRTAESARFPTHANGTTGVKVLTGNVAPGSATFTINEGVGAAGAETWLSLDSLQWRLD